MPDRFVLKRNDLLPAITIHCTYSDGSAVDLTGATSPAFRMRAYGAGDGTAPKVSGVAQVIDAAAGTLRYVWQASDTNTAGLYNAEFEVQLDGKRISFPAGGLLTVQIIEDLG